MVSTTQQNIGDIKISWKVNKSRNFFREIECCFKLKSTFSAHEIIDHFMSLKKFALI